MDSTGTRHGSCVLEVYHLYTGVGKQCVLWHFCLTVWTVVADTRAETAIPMRSWSHWCISQAWFCLFSWSLSLSFLSLSFFHLPPFPFLFLFIFLSVSLLPLSVLLCLGLTISLSLSFFVSLSLYGTHSGWLSVWLAVCLFFSLPLTFSSCLFHLCVCCLWCMSVCVHENCPFSCCVGEWICLPYSSYSHINRCEIRNHVSTTIWSYVRALLASAQCSPWWWGIVIVEACLLKWFLMIHLPFLTCVLSQCQ